MVRVSSRSTINLSHFKADNLPAQIPVEQPAPNDMRPREVDRAKVKAGRKAARRNRRRR